jgi:serine/threonine protein kinase
VWVGFAASSNNVKSSFLKRSLSNKLFIIIMGGCMSGGSSGATYVDQIDGTEEDFHKRYFEDRVLGEGEFGVVKLVHDMQKATSQSSDNSNTSSGSHHDHREPLACKVIRKGIVFKDNTLYAPLKPEVLKMECDILRVLAGQHYCLKLCGIYESSRLVYILTEFCSGGNMLKYVVSVHGDEEDTASHLRTEDVSRIIFQLLDAIHHCAVHRIIHRDIKPDNIMFRYPTPGAELRLIDFGSSTMDSANTTIAEAPEGKPAADKDLASNEELHIHTTFAGSGFYMSPELYDKHYTVKTDVWSAGVVLYVLVAGYPADDLQKAFNSLHKNKRNLRKLPNLPHNLPDSFYDLLEGLLVYRHENRMSAGDFLTHDFVQFHQHLLEEEDDMVLSVEQIAAEAAGTKVANDGDNTTNERKRLGRHVSVPLSGSVARHTIFLGYQKFERAVTTLLAALLTKTELDVLLKTIGEKIYKLTLYPFIS